MQDELNIIVNKLSQLGFSDDDYRNNRPWNKDLGLQYFFKNHEESSWEVYVSYNPYSSLLSIYYCDVYDKENNYPVSFIVIRNQNDALIACDLLDIKSDYLWNREKQKDSQRFTPDSMGIRLRRQGFSEESCENGIQTWRKDKNGQSLTALVEASVSLSIFIFKNRIDTKKDYPVLAVRNIHQDAAMEAVSNYLSNYQKTAM